MLAEILSIKLEILNKDKENTHSHQDGDRGIQETKHLSHVPLLRDNGSKSILGPEKDLRTPAPAIEKKNLVVKEYHCCPVLPQLREGNRSRPAAGTYLTSQTVLRHGHWSRRRRRDGALSARN
jgi:hypothetical protein